MDSQVHKRRHMILQDNLTKSILWIAFPLLVNNFIHATYNIIDTLFVANIGSTEIAAVTFAGPINNVAISISNGLTIAGTSLIGREIGRANEEKAKDIATHLTIIGMFIGIIISTICFVFSKQILILSSITDMLLPISNVYFRLTGLSVFFIFLNACYFAIMRAKGNTIKAMWLNLIAMIIKVVMTYVFIFHLHMGVASLAVSTIIASAVVTIYASYDLFIKKGHINLPITTFKFNKNIILPLLLIGLPIIIEKSSVSFSFIVINKYVIGFGDKVLAAYGVTNRINSIAFSTVSGFGTALAIIISQNLGAEQKERAREAVKKTFYFAIMTSILILSFILIFKNPISSYFAKDDILLLYHIRNAISIYSISVIAWAVFQIVLGVFQGSGHTKYNLVISLVRLYGIRLPLVIILVNYTVLDEYSIWYAMLLSNILTAIFSLGIYSKTKKDFCLAGEKIIKTSYSNN